MPAARVVAVVVGDVVPVIEVARCSVRLVFVVTDGGVRICPELAVNTGGAGLAVPVVELHRPALLVDVAEVEEHVRSPGRDEVDGRGLRWLAASAIAGSRHDERRTGRW